MPQCLKLKEHQQLPYLTVLRKMWFILPVLRPVSSYRPGRLTWRPVGPHWRLRRRVTGRGGRVAQSGTRGRDTHGQSVSGPARRILNLTPPSCHPRRLSPILDYKGQGQALIGDPVKERIQGFLLFLQVARRTALDPRVRKDNR